MKQYRLATLSLALAVALPGTGMASGFALSDKSVSNLGWAFAGTAAHPEDASTLFNNPAGMQRLEPTVSVGAYRIDPSLEFTGEDGTTVTAGDPSYLPNFYYVGRLGEESRYGFGLYAPFGLSIDYGDEWEGRYHTTESGLSTLNIAAGFSTRLTPGWAFGATFDAQYIDADLRRAVDFGSICYGLAQQGLVDVADCMAAGLQPASTDSDGTHRLSGDSWSWGYSFGLLGDLGRNATFGLTYHSSIKQTIDGKSEFAGVPEVAPMPFVFTDSNGSVTLELPPELSLGLAYAVSDNLTAALDYTWTGWSSYDEVRVKFDDGRDDSVEPQKWKDSARYGIGFAFQVNPAWRLRVGYSIDETPVPDAEHRSPRTPDSDRRWHALGVRYAPGALSIDLSYAYVIADEAPINNTETVTNLHTLEGSYDNSFQYIAAQLNWKF